MVTEALVWRCVAVFTLVVPPLVLVLVEMDRLNAVNRELEEMRHKVQNRTAVPGTLRLSRQPPAPGGRQGLRGVIQGPTEMFRTACGTWQSVREMCKAGGGDLVIIKDAAKDARLKQYLQNFDDWGAAPCSYSITWIGGQCGSGKESCRWIDGSAEPYQQAAFSPPGHGFNQVLQTDGTWDSLPGEAAKSTGICEMSVESHKFFLTSLSTWTDARAQCLKAGGDLVMIEDAKKQGQVYNFMRDNGFYKGPKGSERYQQHAGWIGGHDGSKSSWAEVQRIFPKIPSEPGSGGLHYADASGLGSDEVWGTAAVSTKAMGICEK